MMKILSRFREKGLLKPLRASLVQVNASAALFKDLSDDQLQSKMALYRGQLAQGEAFAGVLPEILAFIREVGTRTVGQTAYDEQILAALAMLNGAVAEMATGEGKTLVAPFVAVVHHLQGRKVHISTANEYLAQRDAKAMFPLYKFLGLKIGVRLTTHPAEVTQGVYSCDVVYGVDQTFAQDYLHDNLMAVASAQYQQGLGALILDEADSALIDNAKVPVAVNAVYPADAARYRGLAKLVPDLVRGTENTADCDFYLDGQLRTAILTDAGYDKVSDLLRKNLLIAESEPDYSPVVQQAMQQMVFALTAHYLLIRDEDYVVQDGAIVLVDALTGRLVPGRRWDSGLHQALEAKEGMWISDESVVLGRITLQNYFRLYTALSGMSGTAVTEEEELEAVYGCLVVPIPTHKPCIRVDEPDQFFRNQELKLKAVVADIKATHERGQPVLIGTASVDQSETLSALLVAEGIKHEVLNARQHEREAEIIAQAGALGAVTVSTNMAGRGVDILLGGNLNRRMHQAVVAMGELAWDALSDEERQAFIAKHRVEYQQNVDAVRAAGGLRVLGLERYESRRQDRQLRGRAGRQGDPGCTCFFLSLEDPLIANFAGEKIRSIFDSLETEEGEQFEQALAVRAVDAAQRQVEGAAYDARKAMMTYDNVLDEQRRAIYEQRQQILESKDNVEWISSVIATYAELTVETYTPAQGLVEEWDLPGLTQAMAEKGLTLPAISELAVLDEGQIGDLILHGLMARFDGNMAKIAAEAPPVSADFTAERRAEVVAFHQNQVACNLLVVALGRLWVAHLDALETLRKGIHLRAHAKENPMQAYKREAFKLFEHLLISFRKDVLELAVTFVVAETPVAEPKEALEK